MRGARASIRTPEEVKDKRLLPRRIFRRCPRGGNLRGLIDATAAAGEARAAKMDGPRKHARKKKASGAEGRKQEDKNKRPNKHAVVLSFPSFAVLLAWGVLGSETAGSRSRDRASVLVLSSEHLLAVLRFRLLAWALPHLGLRLRCLLRLQLQVLGRGLLHHLHEDVEVRGGQQDLPKDARAAPRVGRRLALDLLEEGLTVRGGSCEAGRSSKGYWGKLRERESTSPCTQRKEPGMQAQL